MRKELRKGANSHTKHIQLDSKKCEACWKCQEVCPQSVFGKVNFLWHKHIRIDNPDNCIGCLKCIKVCAANAIVKLPKSV